MPPGKTVDVTSYGASGDGRVDDTPAIQAALDSGAAVIEIPSGTYTVYAPLKIGSGTTLRLASDATIRLGDGAGPANGPDGFLIRNADSAGGNSNITIEGGTWDGNCGENSRGDEYAPDTYEGVGLSFINVTGLNLRNLTIRNTESFSVRVGEVTDFLVENITLDYSIPRPNQDGIHVGGFSERGVIRDVHAVSPMTPNDDMVALNADDDVTRHLNRGMKRGWIRDVLVENISAPDAYTFIRLLSNTAELSNITIRNISGGCRYYAINLNRWRFPRSGGNIHDITIENVRVAKVPGNTLPLIPVTLNVRDVSITNFVRTDADETVPTIEFDPLIDAKMVLDLSREVDSDGSSQTEQ